MKHTNNLKLALYESDDAFNITGDSDSLNSNMNIIDESINSLNNEKASKALYGDTTINIGRRANTTVGEYSTAEGKLPGILSSAPDLLQKTSQNLQWLLLLYRILSPWYAGSSGQIPH